MKDPYLRFLLYLVLVGAVVLLPLPELQTERRSGRPMKVSSVSVALVAPASKKPEVRQPLKKAEPKARPPKKSVVPPRSKPTPRPKPKRDPLPLPKSTPKPQPAVNDGDKANTSKTEVVKSPEATAPTTPLQDSRAIEADYFAQVYAAISAKKRYPKKALRFRQEGRVKVRFVVDALGEVTDYTIIQASGHPTFERAVIALFQRVGRLDAPPEELSTPVTMTITLNYTLGE